jgi:dATP pyrophosphohydrolase
MGKKLFKKVLFMNNIKIRVIDCHIAYHYHNDWLFLLLKRASDKIYPGIWQGVTGKIDDNELPYETALRELKEETGLFAKKMWTVDKVNTFYDAEKNIVNLIPVFGVIVDIKKIILSEEHIEYKWCNIDEAIKLLIWDQQKNGVKIFHEMLENNKEKLKFMEIKI